MRVARAGTWSVACRMACSVAVFCCGPKPGKCGLVSWLQLAQRVQTTHASLLLISWFSYVKSNIKRQAYLVLLHFKAKRAIPDHVTLLFIHI